MHILLRTLVSIVILTVASASYAGTKWRVDKVSRPADYTVDSQTWVPLGPGMLVPDSSWIKTGDRGRLLLRRDGELIMFKPNTLATIVHREIRGVQKTDVVQRSGSLLLDVQTRRTKHTTVHTPLLAAVVKGTRFEVSLEGEVATLRVERGTVEAIDISRGERVDVRAEQTVQVSRTESQPLEVQGPGPKAPVTSIEIRRPESPGRSESARGQNRAAEVRGRANDGAAAQSEGGDHDDESWDSRDGGRGIGSKGPDDRTERPGRGNQGAIPGQRNGRGDSGKGEPGKGIGAGRHAESGTGTPGRGNGGGKDNGGTGTSERPGSGNQSDGNEGPDQPVEPAIEPHAEGDPTTAPDSGVTAPDPDEELSEAPAPNAGHVEDIDLGAVGAQGGSTGNPGNGIGGGNGGGNQDRGHPGQGNSGNPAKTGGGKG